jgi:flagellar motor protein MotB
MACKKCKQHECEECPEWIFTLADMVICMMGLFVILWVLKPGPNQSGGDNAEWVRVAAGIREAFGYVPRADPDDPVDVQVILNKLERLRLHGPGDGGPSRMEQRGAEGTDPEVTTIRRGPQASTGGRVLFEPGSAELSAEGADHLDQIALQIRGHRNIVMITGHSAPDDLPEGADVRAHLDLSLRRANLVADYLISRNVEPDILRVQGSGAFEPIVQRQYSPNAQAHNRRVEVEATSSLVRDLHEAVLRLQSAGSTTGR